VTERIDANLLEFAIVECTQDVKVYVILGEKWQILGEAHIGQKSYESGVGCARGGCRMISAPKNRE
jgi:hypothetical protein